MFIFYAYELHNNDSIVVKNFQYLTFSSDTDAAVTGYFKILLMNIL